MDAYLVHSPTSGRVSAANTLLDKLRGCGDVILGAKLVAPHEPHDVLKTASALTNLDPSQCPDERLRPLVRNMQLRQLSNAAKHLEAIREIASNGRLGLIVEDDCMCTDQLGEALRRVVSAMTPDVDVVFLGLPSPRSPEPGGAVSFDDVASVFNILPTCDSYIVTPAAAQKIAAAFVPVRFPTNVQLTLMIRTLGLRAVISVPNVFVDGSKVGVHAATLDPNNRLIWNQSYCQMDMLVRGAKEEPYTGERQEQFQRLWDSQKQFHEHPDMLTLRAEHLVRAGKYRDAEHVYSLALESADRNHCVVNNASELMRGYTALYKHIQQQRPVPA